MGHEFKPAAPSLALRIEPRKDEVVRFLKCAPPFARGTESGIVNLYLSVRNKGREAIRINQVEVMVVGLSNAPQLFPVSWRLEPDARKGWTLPEDYIFAISADPTLRLRFFADGFAEPSVFTEPIAPHVGTPPGGSYRFWGAVRDLRPGEFWQVNGLSHQQTREQMFGYDVGVGVEAGGASHNLLPGTLGNKNEDYRIWGKPVYALASGTVTHFRNDFPTNAVPLSDLTPEIQALIDSLDDGNGNFFTITTGDETALYAHMQAGTLNPALLRAGATVAEGDFLGLAGNSGASDRPHLHVHVNKANTSDQSWNDHARPLPMRNARVVTWGNTGSTADGAPWVKLDGRGVPPHDCAVWPSGAAVVDLKETTLRHFTISHEGQLWVVKSDSQVRTTSDRLPAKRLNLTHDSHTPVEADDLNGVRASSLLPATGVFLDINATTVAKEIAFHGQMPYTIGPDDKLRDRRSGQWEIINGSPPCRRVTIDTARDRVWVVDVNSGVHRFNPATRAWLQSPSVRAKDICVHDGVAHVIGMDDKIWANGANGWTPLPGDKKGRRIAVDARHAKLWLVDADNRIWSHKGGGVWDEHPFDGRAQDIFVHRGTPYIIGTDDGLWRSIGRFGWHRLNVVEPK
jgi:hypothetical protein